MSTRRVLIVLLVFALPVGEAFAAGNSILTQAERSMSHFTDATYTAQNPLLVVGLAGLRTWLFTPAERHGPFAHPLLFLPILFVSMVVYLKDSVLTWLGPLKKPLDALGELVHVAGSLAGILYLGDGMFDAGPQQDPGFFDYILGAISFVCSTVVYVVVWLVFNMVEAIILVNPFPLVDTVLKSGRNGVIFVLTTLAMIDPVLGFIAALPIIIVSFFLAHLAARMTIAAFVHAFDSLGRLFGLVRPKAVPWGFSSWHFAGVPLFSYGKFRQSEDGRLEFVYQRLFFFWERVVPLPSDTLTVGAGSINPYLLGVIDGKQDRILVRFSPRYYGHEKRLCKSLGLKHLSDISLTTSFKNAVRTVWEWVTSPFRAKRAAAAA